jgi:hypothetical protein
MTEAMLSGDIDISYSQGLAPFVTAIQWEPRRQAEGTIFHFINELYNQRRWHSPPDGKTLWHSGDRASN